MVDLNLPDRFNAAEYFIDRNVREGRGEATAIECGDERVSYAALFERVNRVGSALRRLFGVRIEERVALVLLDGPEFIYSFFGAMMSIAYPMRRNEREAVAKFGLSAIRWCAGQCAARIRCRALTD